PGLPAGQRCAGRLRNFQRRGSAPTPALVEQPQACLPVQRRPAAGPTNRATAAPHLGPGLFIGWTDKDKLARWVDLAFLTHAVGRWPAAPSLMPLRCFCRTPCYRAGLLLLSPDCSIAMVSRQKHRHRPPSCFFLYRTSGVYSSEIGQI